MGTLTNRGGFTKSDASEPADVAVYNDNMDRVHSESMSVPYTTTDPSAVDSYPGDFTLRDSGDPLFFLPDFRVYQPENFWKIGTKGTWRSYTPTLAFADLGNGTLQGRYVYIGRLIYLEILLVRGSTTVFEASGLGFSTPGGFTIREPASEVQAYLGTWMARLSGGSNLYKGRVHRRITGVGVDLQPRKPLMSGDGGSEAITDAKPQAWGTGDKIFLQVAGEVTR